MLVILACQLIFKETNGGVNGMPPGASQMLRHGLLGDGPLHPIATDFLLSPTEKRLGHGVGLPGRPVRGRKIDEPHADVEALLVGTLPPVGHPKGAADLLEGPARASECLAITGRNAGPRKKIYAADADSHPRVDLDVGHEGLEARAKKQRDAQGQPGFGDEELPAVASIHIDLVGNGALKDVAQLTARPGNGCMKVVPGRIPEALRYKDITRQYGHFAVQ